MELFDLLRPEAVRVMSKVSSKKRLIAALGDLAQSALGLDSGDTVAALQERESLGPTGVGNGVALPHARLPGVERVMGSFILLETPVMFDAVDQLPVDIVFALFAPQNAGFEHLSALAKVSRLLRDMDLRNKLRANPNSKTLY
ncbi:MAG: PTS transporter subunit EIIA, partial [Rhodobacteraceae bacterium]|nr:PTS transporter subunit EIIA [Paracoccaceae bacterium]